MIHLKKYLSWLLLLLILFTGCGKKSQEVPAAVAAPDAAHPAAASSTFPAEPAKAPSADLQEPTVYTNPADSEAVYEGCATNGHVTEFDADGCTISVALIEDLQGGVSVMTGASPGHEDQFPTAQIRYAPDCVFTRVLASLSTGEIQCESVCREDVKKQTYLVVHGQTDSDGTVIANVVYLYRVVE